MANEHFFPGEYFSSGLAAPFLGASYVQPPRSGFEAAAAMAFGLPWADQHLPLDSSATTAHFDSALSSLVSSPASATAGGGLGFAHGGEDNVGDLIGRLSSICNGASANNSCYSTPLSSPPRGAPQPFRGYGAIAALETVRLSRASSSKSLVGNTSGVAATAPLDQSAQLEMSPETDSQSAMQDPPTKKGAAGSARKRKAAPAKGKAKACLPAVQPSCSMAAINTSPPKRPRVADGGNDENAGAVEEEEKAEPAKDYIHVRARRGQATDSHSLAERVRREKIGERMKLLQSLVPSCNKITGKALMLDEIINYVQSLQRQVEFLSMKLSTMNPQLELDEQHVPSKEMDQMAVPGFSYAGSLAVAAGHGHGAELEGTFGWEQDLQSMVQMGAASGSHSQEPQAFYGQAATTVNHMKVEP